MESYLGQCLSAHFFAIDHVKQTQHAVLLSDMLFTAESVSCSSIILKIMLTVHRKMHATIKWIPFYCISNDAHYFHFLINKRKKNLLFVCIAWSVYNVHCKVSIIQVCIKRIKWQSECTRLVLSLGATESAIREWMFAPNCLTWYEITRQIQIAKQHNKSQIITWCEERSCAHVIPTYL